MEVTGQHCDPYKRWGIDRDPFFSGTRKDRKLGGAAGGGGGGGAGGGGGGGGSWSNEDRQGLSPLSSIISRAGGVDKVLYQNLVEMIPLVETLMDQQNGKSFMRHASLIYTPTPSRDACSRSGQTAESSSRVSKSHAQPAGGHKGNLKYFWENGENVFQENQGLYSEDISMLSFSSDFQVDQTGKAKVLQLQSQIEQLEQHLQEKGSLLQVAKNSSQQVELLRLQRCVEKLQKEIQAQGRELEEAKSQLLAKKYEVLDLHSQLGRAEAEVQASNVQVAKVKEELDRLLSQVLFLLSQTQSRPSSFKDEMCTDKEDVLSTSAVDPEEVQEVEQSRRSYLAALIAAREIPSDELLTLAFELRAQLQAHCAS